MSSLLTLSGASKSVLSKEIYENLPEPKAILQNTNMKFPVSSRSIITALGVCHIPLKLRFDNMIKSISLPIFICDFLSPEIDCIFGRTITYDLCNNKGTLWLRDDPDDYPLYCISKVRSQKDNYYARVMKWTPSNTKLSFNPKRGKQVEPHTFTHCFQH